MIPNLSRFLAGAAVLTGCAVSTLLGQGGWGPPPGDMNGPPMGRPWGGGMQAPETKLVEQFDANGNKRLDADERATAREFMQNNGGGFRRRGPRGRAPATIERGATVRVADVAPVAASVPFYDNAVVRTIFLDFENDDWEAEMEAFNNTDVEVPARLTVDGKVYEDVGVHFRGASSFMTVPTGQKRSLNVSVDFVHDDQNVLGHRTLNLLNSHLDPTFLRSVLYYEVARAYVPAYRANHVRVVINGEDWGVYVNVEQFNKDFVEARFGTSKGSRWKVPGSPRGRGGLNYLGDEPEPYKAIYEIKTKDSPKSWEQLITLTRILNQTKPESLEAALEPVLDIDGALKFLAVENVLINSDGYWTRASDYNLYADEKGKFHVIPHDANETFREPEGPGMSGGGDAGLGLDPLIAAHDLSKPLLSRLLASPTLKARYLGYVREIAETWLDWGRLGPIAERYQKQIEPYVKADKKKLDTYENFTKGVTEETLSTGMRGGEWVVGLKDFVEMRRAYLLAHPEIRALPR